MSSTHLTLTRVSASVVIALSAACAATTAAANAQEYVKSYPVTGRAEVHVQADDGGVHVITSDTGQVEFRVTTEDSGWGLGSGESPKIESRQSGNRVELTVRVHSPHGLGFGHKRTNIEIRMPRNADLQLDTGDGGIDVSSLNGHIALHTGDGGINASQLSGAIDIDSGDGGITVEALKGDVKLHTGDGGIRGTHLDGTCKASTGNGGIHIDGRFDLLDLRSGDGGVSARAEAGSRMSSGWSLHTGDGAVHLTIPVDLKANLDASTGDGHIALNLPVAVQGKVDKTHLSGTLNGGGPSIDLHTGDGMIDLDKL